MGAAAARPLLRKGLGCQTTRPSDGIHAERCAATTAGARDRAGAALPRSAGAARLLARRRRLRRPAHGAPPRFSARTARCVLQRISDARHRTHTPRLRAAAAVRGGGMRHPQPGLRGRQDARAAPIALYRSPFTHRMWRADAPPSPPPPPPPPPLLPSPASPPLLQPRQPEPSMAETSATAGSAIVVLLVGLGGGAAFALWWGRRCRARERRDGVAEVGTWDESCREGTPPGGDPLDSLPVLRGAALAEHAQGLHALPPSHRREGPPFVLHPPLR